MSQRARFVAAKQRPLPVIILADVSGSMTSDSKIDVLNDSMAEMYRAFAGTTAGAGQFTRVDQLESRIGVRAVIDERLRHVWLALTHEDYAVALRCHEDRRRTIARGILTTTPGRDATMTVRSFGPEETLFPVAGTTSSGV